MGAAFTKEEQILIKQDLKNTARNFLLKYGMRKTSVDQIVAEVCISKGAFYKFYETKELLFFEIMEDIHDEIYAGVDKILKSTTDLPVEQRIEKSLLYAIDLLNQTSILNFIINELPLVLRKLPPEKIHSHIHDDSVNVGNLLKENNIFLPYPTEFVSSLVRGIACLSREKDFIGEAQYMEVIHFIIHSSCNQIISDCPEIN